MSNAQWKKYTGSEEQIAEMDDAKNGFICKNDYGYIWDDVYIDWSKCPIGATQYLICNPHPYADVIKKWEDTGQPVWVRQSYYDHAEEHHGAKIFTTTTPDWNIPGAEYRLSPFEEEV